MIDLSTKYLGIQLKNPLVASASPLCENIEHIKQMEKSGIAAIVLHSLFEEQVILQEKELNYALTQQTESYAESLSYLPDINDYRFAPDEYVDYIAKVKKAVDIPIIGSLNGISNSGWIRYGKKIEEAGADALELNIYYLPTTKTSSCQEIEQIYLDLVKRLRQNITIPIAVKLSPYFNSIPGITDQLAEEGADGLVLFNRFYQPDIDLTEMSVIPNLELSRSSELRLRLRWVAILYQKVKADLAITGGIHTIEDIIKGILAGANVTMMTSALLEKGIPYIDELIKGTEEWLRRHQYHSINEIRGLLSQQNVKETDAFERANYMKVLKSYHYE
ncbi:MAG TPA: dihydroorotate dehydrogenase-like protein [Atribacterota bacterium]|nr:dihydroorotate dehydrogenase-like protein [Atribacterota bacterium]